MLNQKNQLLHLYFVVLLLFCLQSFPKTIVSQTEEIDSLENEIRTSDQPDQYKFDLYYYLSKNYQKVDIDKSTEIAFNLLKMNLENDSLYYATYALDLIIANYEELNKYDSCVKYLNQAIQISKDLNKPHDVAYFRNWLGNVQIQFGEYYDALNNLQDAVNFAKSDSSLTNYVVAFLTNIGGIYHYLGDDLKALDYFLQSYHIKKEKNLTGKLSPSLINIASVYSKLEKFEEAVDFHKEALKIARENDNKYYQVKALTGLGFDYYLQRDFKTSIDYYLQALELSDSVSDKTAKANIMAKLSNAYNETGHRDRAIGLAEDALSLSRKISYSYGISSFSRTLGDLYLAEKKYSLALPLFLESIKVSDRIGAMDEIKDSYFSVSKLYEALNEPQKALKFFKLFSSVNDSLLKHEEADKYTVVQIKYEMEKKAREVENLTFENEIQELRLTESRYMFYGSIAFFSLVVLFLVLFIRQNRMRSLQKTIILEQKLLRSQMNPHFIFNTLSAIQKYIYDKSSVLATDYLGRFSKLMRFILQSSSTEKIKLEDEITFLDNYLKLQALRFDNKFSYTLETDPEMESESMLITPMLIQPFIENAVEHGLRPLDKGGQINIQVNLKESQLEVVVTDNGIGREESKRLKEQDRPGHKSMAIDITQERLAHLNKKSNRNTHFNIIDLSNNGEATGTQVIIHMPFEYI